MTRRRPRLTTNWDALVTSAPANAQAAKDAGAKGGAFVPRKTIYDATNVYSELAPLPTRRVDAAILNNGEFKDYTGLRVGKLTVIGLSALTGSSSARWVVRCVCGIYEHRKTSRIKTMTPDDRSAQCQQCDYVAGIRSGREGVDFPKQMVRA